MPGTHAVSYTACSARLYVGQGRRAAMARVKSIKYRTTRMEATAWKPLAATEFAADAPLLMDGTVDDTATGYRIPAATESSRGTLCALIDLGGPRPVTKGTFAVAAPETGTMSLCRLWSSNDGRTWTQRSASSFNQTGTGNMGVSGVSARYWQFLFGTTAAWPPKTGRASDRP